VLARNSHHDLCVGLEVSLPPHAALLWILAAATACTAAPQPASVAEPAVTSDAARDPNPPLDTMSSLECPPQTPEPEPAPSFEPAPVPWRAPETVVSRGRRGCSVNAVLDPEVLVIYSMIDVYALIGGALELRPTLLELAEQPPCAGDLCQPNAPNAVLIDDGGDYPIDGRAFGFVVPINDGYWVLPLEQVYREQRCMPDVEAETVEDGHARVTLREMQVIESDSCDPDGEDDCEYGCFYGGARQYDLFYDAETERALLVTRSHDELDDSDDPTPAIEVTREADAVRIVGCKADHAVPWPPA
jgi:hypothetical protein